MSWGMRFFFGQFIKTRPTNQNATILTEANAQEGFPTKTLIPTTDRVLFADATLNSQLNGAGSWSSVAGGFTGSEVRLRFLI